MGNATYGMGTVFKIGVSAIGELTEIEGISMSAETVDITTLSSSNGYREFVQGLKDGGEVTMSGFFYPADAGQTALIAAFEGGTTDTYTITFPTGIGKEWIFSGIITAITTGVTMEDPVTFECTIKVTGKPSLSAVV